MEKRLRGDLMTALRAGDEVRKRTLRMALDAIHKASIPGEKETGGGRKAMDDEAIEVVISGEARRRRDAIEAYEEAGRKDLAEEEASELAVLQEYLPPRLDEAEITQMARDIVREIGASGLAQLGPVMGQMMARLSGRAEGRTVQEIVRRVLEEDS